LRLRLAERGDPEPVARLIAESGLAQSVRANPLTGSIVAEFRGPPADLIARLVEMLPIEVAPGSAASQKRASLALATSRPFRLAGDSGIHPLAVLGTCYGAIGAVQAVRGHLLVPSLTAFWYAINAFRMAQATPHKRQGSVAE
jgi:hypothetical protein